MARMLGKTYNSRCGCCDQRAGSGTGKAGARRVRKRRERNEWRKNLGVF